MGKPELVALLMAEQKHESESWFDAFIAYCRRHPRKYFISEELDVLENLLQPRSRHWSMERNMRILERLSALCRLTQEEQEKEIEVELAHVSSKVWLQNPLNLFVLGCKREYEVKEFLFMPERERFLRAAFIILLTTS